MAEKKSLKLFGFAVCIGIGILIGLLANPLYNIVSSITFGRNLQTLSAPNNSHTAKLLKKYNFADINFVLKVDGVKVYTSPDYLSFPDHLYRETLVWDKSGEAVLLELMAKRVFGYNAKEKREITKDELEKYEFYPTATDKNYAPILDMSER